MIIVKNGAVKVIQTNYHTYSVIGTLQKNLRASRGRERSKLKVELKERLNEKMSELPILIKVMSRI